MKTYIQQRATEIDKVTGERIFNRKAYNELKIRLLLRKIQVVDAPVQPFDLEVAVSTEGHMELTPKSAELIWKSDPLLVSAFISQLDRVLEMGENPETINKSILEGEERLDLSSGLKRFFEAFSLPKEKIDEALEALATGPLKDYFPKSSEESVKTS